MNIIPIEKNPFIVEIITSDFSDFLVLADFQLAFLNQACNIPYCLLPYPPYYIIKALRIKAATFIEEGNKEGSLAALECLNGFLSDGLTSKFMKYSENNEDSFKENNFKDYINIIVPFIEKHQIDNLKKIESTNSRTMFESIMGKKMGFAMAGEIKRDCEKFLSLIDRQLLLIFDGKIPKIMLPYSKEIIIDALNIVKKHLGIQSIQSVLNQLDFYVNNEAFRVAAEKFEETNNFFHSLIPRLEEIQNNRFDDLIQQNSRLHKLAEDLYDRRHPCR